MGRRLRSGASLDNEIKSKKKKKIQLSLHFPTIMN